MSFPNLIDDIILTLKKRGLTDLLVQALPDKRRDNSHIPYDILLCLAVAAKLKCKTSFIYFIINPDALQSLSFG